MAPLLTAMGGALEKMMIAFLGRVARGAPMVEPGLSAVEDLSCGKEAKAEFEGKVSLGVAVAERGREVIPVD